MAPRTFLLQLLPLLVFIVVDALVDDVRVSIAAAVVFAVVQLAITWARSKKFDWFVVLDVALIAGLGGLSIALENELFFKLKPALIEAVTVVLMLGLVFAPDRFLAGYLGRLTPGLVLEPQALKTMRRSFAWMSGYVVLHLLAVLFTAFYASKQTWALVSGPGFYVGLAPIALGLFLRRRRARDD